MTPHEPSQPTAAEAPVSQPAADDRNEGAGGGEGAVAPQAAHDVAPEAEPVAGEVIGHSLLPRKARTRGEPRSPITTRLTFSMQDRLFRASTLTGRTQQALIEDALEALLRKLKV